MTLSPVVFDITIACIFFYAVYGGSTGAGLDPSLPADQACMDRLVACARGGGRHDLVRGAELFSVYPAAHSPRPSYFTVSVALTTWRTKLRRQMNERDIVTRGIHTDGAPPRCLTR